MRLALILVVAALILGGCGGGGGGGTIAKAPTDSPPTARAPAGSGRLPPGTVAPADTAGEAGEGPAALEASPEASAQGPGSTGGLPSGDRSEVAAVVGRYVTALNRRDAARVCALLVPGSLDTRVLPKPRRGCRLSLRASIGVRPRGGGPAWRRTALVEVKAEALGDDRARVSATVTHRFSDRKYVSVEDDVIYLERVRGRWLIAKPSGTLYRAVGYPEPPLSALTPPAGW